VRARSHALRRLARDAQRRQRLSTEHADRPDCRRRPRRQVASVSLLTFPASRNERRSS